MVNPRIDREIPFTPAPIRTTYYVVVIHEDGSQRRLSGFSEEKAKDEFALAGHNKTVTFAQWGAESDIKGGAPINQYARDFSIKEVPVREHLQ